VLDLSNSFWHAQEVLVAARLLRHNRAAKTLRLCDNPLCVALGSGAGSAYPRSGFGDLCLTLTPPLRGLHGPPLSVVGRPPPLGHAKRRPAGDNGRHSAGVVEDWVLREGRPPLYDPTNWFEGVSLSLSLGTAQLAAHGLLLFFSSCFFLESLHKDGYNLDA
jgi:hypothetical protein